MFGQTSWRSRGNPSWDVACAVATFMAVNVTAAWSSPPTSATRLVDFFVTSSPVKTCADGAHVGTFTSTDPFVGAPCKEKNKNLTSMRRARPLNSVLAATRQCFGNPLNVLAFLSGDRGNAPRKSWKPHFWKSHNLSMPHQVEYRQQNAESFHRTNTLQSGCGRVRLH